MTKKYTIKRVIKLCGVLPCTVYYRASDKTVRSAALHSILPCTCTQQYPHSHTSAIFHLLYMYMTVLWLLNALFKCDSQTLLAFKVQNSAHGGQFVCIQINPRTWQRKEILRKIFQKPLVLTDLWDGDSSHRMNLEKKHKKRKKT